MAMFKVKNTVTHREQTKTNTIKERKLSFCPEIRGFNEANLSLCLLNFSFNLAVNMP